MALPKMLLLRGLAFTALVPLAVGMYLPQAIRSGRDPVGGAANAGWVLILLGAALYAGCFGRFLRAGGTPAIFFARRLRPVIGEEPGRLVSQGLYRFSRNPMYIGVLLAIFGQAVLYGSAALWIYGAGVWLFFHLAVVVAEEPHLRAAHGREYVEYCRKVPRWLRLKL